MKIKIYRKHKFKRKKKMLLKKKNKIQMFKLRKYENDYY
jgi:hypothetical protein